MGRFKVLVFGLLVVGNVFLFRQVASLKVERDRYMGNTEALLSDVKRLQVDSCRMALDVSSVRLTLEEYKRFRAEDAEIIRGLGVRLRDLERVARHELRVDAGFEVILQDTVVLRDTVAVGLKRIEMDTPHLKVSGMIEDGELKGRIVLPVVLHQAFWVEYGRRFLWWRWKVKGVRQVISCDNPFVEIGYSEVVLIER